MSPSLSARLLRPALSASSPLRQALWFGSASPARPRRLPHPPTSACPRSYASRATVSASELLFGQPVHETHPHLLRPGELTPGISAQEYHERRAALCRNLPSNSAVLLPSAAVTYRSGAVFHAFRQESNFLYLTGFSEPDSLAVLRKEGPAADDYVFHLFCRPKNPKAEQWTGPWSGLDAARDVWNADEVADIAKIEAVLPDVLNGVTKIYTDAELTKSGVPTKLGNVVRAAADNIPTAALRQHVNALRAIKSPAEIANMRHAGQESGRALTAAMSQHWEYEKDLAAFLDYQYQTRGLDGHAYIPVIAGGPKALLIHYVLNNGILNDDEFILVDSGGEYGTYITDITRTWPASGKFSPAQKDLYNAVLKAQRASVSLCRASANMTLDKIHHITDTALRDQLQALGFQLKGNEMSVLFPHHVGHYIGLDVHDTPGYSRGEVLREGHCVTIEPGIYVPDDDRFPPAFRGLGVRIEDSVCVGEENPLILTTEAVKEVDDIEALRS
ncbi:peptidase M24, structural domain-containing protein [Microdochium trichocladiopsis]|uniref:Xaa-Pro aminopeptidase n=1 Tax=Microdochium trichocladiopsis TaxID=1682393 RepID=A0A9P8YL22_9PEZI|nr:peptidase M24, structural domain-containing protein [Microdochium trichocladiopsis]KAH7040960.1 peptidase M24, structural domain-containing protein [Microdochium trichocladiopsis]